MRKTPDYRLAIPSLERGVSIDSAGMALHLAALLKDSSFILPYLKQCSGASK